MKAQRRHELKTNALARGLEGLPDYWREYGNRVLLFIIACLVVFLAVRYWRDKRDREARLVADSLQSAQTALGELDRLPMRYGAAMQGQSDALAKQRESIVQTADGAINSVINDAKDPKMLANGYLAKAELNWRLANLPDIPGAQTRPSLRLQKSPDELLNAARSAYQQVLQMQPAADPLAVFQAHVGLAAIAENQHQWDDARKQYQTIVDAPNLPQTFKDYAKDRLANLPQIESPVVLGEGPDLFGSHSTTEPTTAPVFGPLQLPSTTQPSTQSAAPAPASRPTTAP